MSYLIISKWPCFFDQSSHVMCVIASLGIKLLDETILHCRECAALDSSQAYAKLNSYIFSGGPSRAVYILEVRKSLLSSTSL